MIIFLPKHTELDTADCIRLTGQKATTSKFTLRLAIIIHQLSDSLRSRISIAKLILASMRLLFVQKLCIK